MTLSLSRRGFLGAAAGGLVVAFSLAGPLRAQEQAEGPELPGDLADTPNLDAWIRISPEGDITVFTGKAELGQGIKTALRMVAAEELSVVPGEIELITADTGLTPDEGFTAGSQSMSNSGMAIRHAAANVRVLLLEEAARQLGVEAASLTVGTRLCRAVAGRWATATSRPRSTSRSRCGWRCPIASRATTASSAPTCSASTFRARSRAARPTFRTCGPRAWSMPASSDRRAPARPSPPSMRRASRPSPGPGRRPGRELPGRRGRA
ncbi:Isoquinoline 1-oxidoreductase beta subunit [Rubellimicrobium mesophilum DSM 19309]|uniref:Isoquinoline 1-oxidoreductase beta subunit n=1 Tax=Rubellimicrobium mesophilum DSM 19309 TaxID=442562 RepID=A0A017HIW1_9RHOB|nr:Isoquinoline 1-oxidoreductase beta subunit [Rubellimicrobium mesophilum DSM 19309]